MPARLLIFIFKCVHLCVRISVRLPPGNEKKSLKRYSITHGITMYDVSIVKVCHEADANDREDKNEELFVI